MRDHLGMPLKTEIGDRKAMSAAAPELLTSGDWVCLNIEPTATWPIRPQSLTFAGHTIWIIPVTQEEHPGVAMKRPEGLDREEASGILYRLLSVIAWRENMGITVAYSSGGNLPRMMGLDKKFGFAIREEFDFTEIICPEEEGPRIALALMREARGLNHSGYAFLSYWRVLELAFGKDSKARVAWMEATLPTLAGQGVDEAKASILDQGIEDICLHLRDSGRCAIAHATGQPIINPDDPRDARRMQRELPLVRELAVRVIEEKFGIPSRSTEYRQHLYELRGWKRVFGEDLVGRLLSGEGARHDESVDFPDIHVRLYQSPPYPALENLTINAVELEGARARLTYLRPDGLFGVRFVLDFAEERLLFDLEQGLYGRDDGSVTAAEYRRDVQRFIRDYLLNGVLQMWEAESGALLSRLDAYLPLNCMVDLDACNANIAEAEAEIERRRNPVPQPAWWFG